MDVRKSHVITTGAVVLALAVLAPAVVTSAAGEEPEKPQPALTTKASATQSRRPQSLAGLAATIRLRKPAGDPTTGVVIDEATLDKLAKTGVISTSGSAAAVTEEPVAEAAPTTRTTPSEDLQKRFDKQLEKIENLEKGLEEFDQRVQEKRTPHTSIMPHDLPPGVRNPNLITREGVEAEIAEERTKLQSMQRQARRTGVELKQQQRDAERAE